MSIAAVPEPADDRTLLDVDGRGRVSLGRLARHRRYLAAVEPDGTIVLTPAVVMPEMQARLWASPVAATIEDAINHPDRRVRRRRPARRTDPEVGERAPGEDI